MQKIVTGLEDLYEHDIADLDMQGGFLIFDYCNNFEFFGTKPNGYEGSDTKSLSENIFGKRVRLIMALQETAFSEDKYQQFRNELISICNGQVIGLNMELIAVRLKKQFVEKYKNIGAFQFLSESDKGELVKEIAPVVAMDDKDETAKRFDNFIYGMILADIEALPGFHYARKQLCDVAAALEKKYNIPQVKEKLPLIKEIQEDAFWDANDILGFERVRKEIRGLMKFLIEDSNKPPMVVTKLTDPVLEEEEGIQLDPAYDFEDYRKKVNRYIEEHKDSVAIYKLTHNKRLAEGDYKELERVFTEELGSREDYQREFGDTPFGLLIRKIAKMEHEAAMEAFSEFINDASLNQRQITFINKIINHIEQNGYMDNVRELQKPPFDKPVPFVKMFDVKIRTSLMQTINEIKENALNIIA